MCFPSAQLEVVQVCTDINWWVATFDDRIDGDLMQGNVAMEDTARVSLIQQVAAAFCASSGPHCRVTDPVDPHVLYAQQ
ncbi:hypothetical protein WJX82_009669 [Trebouxia sp. C0006]